jgi:molybdopterin-synthase adenylyltransferase
MLSEKEYIRYHRHISLPQIDIKGQEQLKQAQVLIVGLGGLGCTVSQYLGSSGVGHMTLLDFDRVELSNLPRQILHDEHSIGWAKVTSAQHRLNQLNGDIEIEALDVDIDDSHLESLVARQDLVVDCTDNVSMRHRLNRFCNKHQIPWVSAAVIRMEGLVTTFNVTQDQGCYACFQKFFHEQQLSCSQRGVFAPVVGVIGSVQAVICLKLLLGLPTYLEGHLLWCDCQHMSFYKLALPIMSDCDLCPTEKVILNLG